MRIFDICKDHLVSLKMQGKFCMIIGNVEHMHECFPKHWRMGTATMK